MYCCDCQTALRFLHTAGFIPQPPRGCEFTPFTDEDTEALSGQETCPNDGGRPCAHHGDGDSIGPPLVPQSVGNRQ